VRAARVRAAGRSSLVPGRRGSHCRGSGRTPGAKPKARLEVAQLLAQLLAPLLQRSALPCGRLPGAHGSATLAVRACAAA